MSDAEAPVRDFPSVMAIANGYGLSVSSYSPHEGGYLLEASEGRFWLKPFAGSEAELRFVVAADEHVRGRGFTRLCRCLRLSDGSAGVCFRRLPYWLLELPATEAPPLTTIEELRNLGAELARFHLAGQGFAPPADLAEVRVEWAGYERQFKERLLDLYDFQELCYDRVRPTRFDQEYIDRFNEFVDDARRAINMLAELPLVAMVATARREGQLCHGSFTRESLAADAAGGLLVTDAELTCFDLRVRDLAELIRSVAERDAERAVAICDGYGEVCPLTVEELQIIKATLIFPRDFWRAARAYYRDGVNTRANISDAVAALDPQRRFVESLDRLSLPVGDWYAVYTEEQAGPAPAWPAPEPVEPVAAEPAPGVPAETTAEPVEPMAAEPIEPVAAELAEPIAEEPVPLEPVLIEPAIAQPVSPGPSLLKKLVWHFPPPMVRHEPLLPVEPPQ